MLLGRSAVIAIAWSMSSHVEQNHKSQWQGLIKTAFPNFPPIVDIKGMILSILMNHIRTHSQCYSPVCSPAGPSLPRQVRRPGARHNTLDPIKWSYYIAKFGSEETKSSPTGFRLKGGSLETHHQYLHEYTHLIGVEWAAIVSYSPVIISNNAGL